jgi:aldehyde dehydrogenase (NAD+)
MSRPLPPIAQAAPITRGLIINGSEAPARSGETFAVYNPASASIVGYAAKADRADVERAVTSARTAAQVWAALSPAERERALLRAADIVEAEADSLIDLCIDESGSTLSKARFEARYTSTLIRAAAGEVRRLYGDTFPNDRPHRLSLVVREPLGVVAAISPFNSPIALFAKMIVFAIAAGNSMIAKPSEETPLTALALASLINRALPGGVLNIITGYGPDTGAALVEHPGIDGIAFTGSTQTGIAIGQAAMKTMKRVQLELGGKNPLVVLNDAADPPIGLERAAAIAAVGAFFHGGQICMSNTRIIAERGIAHDFAHALARRAEALHLGDLRDERTAYGPLINLRAVEKVERHLRIAREAGAELLTGGQRLDGLRFQPTVLLAPAQPERLLASETWHEETFGPVVVVVEARDLDHAVALANDSDYGLSAAVLTNDLQRGLLAARRIRAGSVHVGAIHAYQSDALAPIGGYGYSGIGRSGGRYTVEHFTEQKWISIELGEPPLPF